MKIIQLSTKSNNVIEYGLNYILRKLGSRHKIELGGPGKGNAGDTVLGECFGYIFNKEFSGSRVLFKNCRKIYTQADVNKINNADLLFVCGQGLFLYDSFPNLVSDWQWGISEDLLGKIEVPIVVYSVGFNKFRRQLDFNENFNKTVTKLIEKSIFFSLRNTGSCNAIKNYVPEKLHERIRLNYCPTLLYNERFNFHNYRNSKNVGFVLSGDRLKNRHVNIFQFINHIKSFVDYLKDKGFRTILIDHNDDRWITDYVEFDHFINLWGKSGRDIYRTYSQIDTVVGDRGHSVMIPFACGCRIMSPISHDKTKWFLEDMDLQQFGVEENDADLAEKLIDKFDQLQNIDWVTMHQEKMKMIRETNTRNMAFIKAQLSQFVKKSF